MGDIHLLRLFHDDFLSRWTLVIRSCNHGGGQVVNESATRIVYTIDDFYRGLISIVASPVEGHLALPHGGILERIRHYQDHPRFRDASLLEA